MNNAANNTFSASPAKLRNGSWGARVQGSVQAGDVVTITTRSGKSWQAIVTQAIWSGEGVTICATESCDRKPAARKPSRRGTWSGCSCGSVEEFIKATDCWTCRHDAE